MLVSKPLFWKVCHYVTETRPLPTIRLRSSLPPRLSFLAEECKSIEQLKQIHAQMILADRVQDQFALSKLISFLALYEHGDLCYAMKILENAVNPNNFMWNTLIRAHADSTNPLEGLKIYLKMTRVGTSPNDHTYPFVLKACSCVKSLHTCKQLHAQVFKRGFISDSQVVNALVRCYSVCSDVDNARKIFDEIPAKNLSAWTVMICGFAQNSFLNDATHLFNRMVSEGFEPKGLILSSLLSACAHSGCLQIGKKIHAYMDETRVEINVILGSALVYMYAKNGEISVARSIFYSMKEKNIGTWNSMICGLASHGHAPEALDLFLEIEKKNTMPNDVTFVGVLSAGCHAGLLHRGKEIFSVMNSVYGIEPKIEHYGCMVDLLSRKGNLLDAEELIRGMPCRADAAIWGALLSGCENHQNVEVAERAAREMLALEPYNHGVYVVLSNIYADAGRYKDIERLRKMMKRKSLPKTPGWSFVGVDDWPEG